MLTKLSYPANNLYPIISHTIHIYEFIFVVLLRCIVQPNFNIIAQLHTYAVSEFSAHQFSLQLCKYMTLILILKCFTLYYKQIYLVNVFLN